MKGLIRVLLVGVFLCSGALAESRITLTEKGKEPSCSKGIVCITGCKADKQKVECLPMQDVTRRPLQGDCPDTHFDGMVCACQADSCQFQLPAGQKVQL